MFCDLLVGSTGFVGGNLLAKHTFAAACHSSDITAQYGTRPDLCVYAGVPAAMFLAKPVCDEDRLADTVYGGREICAAASHGSVLGCQFHPEKSGVVGLKIIEEFLK